MEWNSRHIFIHDMTYHDLFLKEYLIPFLDERKDAVARFFFIRYWQGGPHIRFRYQSSGPELLDVSLENTLQLFKKRYQPQFKLSKEAYYQEHSFDGGRPPEEELYWIEDMSIKEIPYKPEYERYGGKEIMAFSESIFHQTSKMALYKLRETKGPISLSSKLLLACDFFLMMLDYLTEKEQEELLVQYELFWSRFDKKGQIRQEQIQKFRTLFWKQKSISNSSVFNRFEREIEEINKNVASIIDAGKRDKLPYLIFSYIHMYNNRIGLPPNLESSAAKILKKTKEGVES
ncbi:hypothetical protein FZC84_14135 [Rossellomorea vietnamensis]|uniref:Thiopeptide-type bacteriocin biosynthesis domain-containing protein n=1 Tax=Rossellomorea vietnamensis TaxID=218284 RepID=A0A5D4MAW0_9BACI|nr:thiopeptide-type bacteriocin biosynthesis protein [Rossellomorea vietnamensis]TYR98567.1 hypothetical protein FZC84_14135 [Rossellomorea vietnamensis]